MQGKLNVAAAFHPQLRHNVERSGAEHLVLLVAQGNRRCNNNAVTGVDADRVEIFH